VHALGVAASHSTTSRTRQLLDAVLYEASGHAGVTTSIVTLADRSFPPVEGTRAGERPNGARETLLAIDEADAVVFGMPVYRGSIPGSLKRLLDLMLRGRDDAKAHSLRAKPVAVVATGASEHHSIAIDDLTAVLRETSAAHVVSPGVYASADGFEGGSLTCALARRTAVQTGSALVDVYRAIATSRSLAESEPLL
jgi:FMN reductase